MDIALQILGTGEHIPSRRVDSEEFDRRWSQEPGWTYQQTGVRSRAFVGADEDAITMGAAAARQALDAAQVRPSQLDAIISVGSVPYQPIPCTAAFLQQALDLENSGIPAFDINSTCLGFLVAVDLVAQAIATGRYRAVLIVASEPASVALDWEDLSTAGLFGDGAGAVVLGAPRREGPTLRASHVQTFSSGVRLCQIRAGGSSRYARSVPEQTDTGMAFEMKGPATYRLAAARLPAFMATLLDRARVAAADIDYWIPHQASGQALSHLQAVMRLAPERFIVTLETAGNQVSASLPIALHRGIASQTIKPGQLIAFLGAGAGLSLGGAVLSF